MPGNLNFSSRNAGVMPPSSTPVSGNAQSGQNQNTNNNSTTGHGMLATATTIPNSEAFCKLHHYVYPPTKTNTIEVEKSYQQMGLKLGRIRGDEQTPLSVPQATPETVSKRRDKRGFFSMRLTAIFDVHNDFNHRGVFFDPIVRNVGPCSEILIGRYTERLNENLKELPEIYKPALFKSKVVSRTHGCFKVDIYGNWYVQDLKSSSGTFLNHQRIAPASTLSEDFLLKDGDVIQLGMDFRGGQEELYRCIKFRVELNNSWKLKATQFNKEVLDKMKNIFNLESSQQEDCSICLTKLKPCQPIFISPCAHTWHYSCIRRILSTAYPQFDCPNCRKRTDLEATLESDSDDDGELDDYENETDNADNDLISNEMINSKNTLNQQVTNVNNVKNGNGNEDDDNSNNTNTNDLNDMMQVDEQNNSNSNVPVISTLLGSSALPIDASTTGGNNVQHVGLSSDDANVSNAGRSLSRTEDESHARDQNNMYGRTPF
ncbi:E3 ubiquitin-protein ligase DMA2 [Hanseniaspora osmophila]|uniref:RING-type E3 ubiquitin transferase n=1 Tax=Hanseniaspora osmophila TaxID=56408 RepID=A0A1E5RN24_9ASCO|nr:E3 ubiquitin-protein ligase DMA2 [Hanseniaspora osmophila]